MNVSCNLCFNLLFRRFSVLIFVLWLFCCVGKNANCVQCKAFLATKGNTKRKMIEIGQCCDEKKQREMNISSIYPDDVILVWNNITKCTNLYRHELKLWLRHEKNWIELSLQINAGKKEPIKNSYKDIEHLCNISGNSRCLRLNSHGCYRNY